MAAKIKGMERVLEKVRRIERNAREVVRSMNGKGVTVSIPKDAKYPNGESVRAVASFIEFGTARMAPRPFMRTARAAHGQEWKNLLRREMRKAAKGQESVDDGLMKTGDKILSDIRSSITEYDAVDTGRLRSSYKVKVS